MVFNEQQLTGSSSRLNQPEEKAFRDGEKKKRRGERPREGRRGAFKALQLPHSDAVRSVERRNLNYSRFFDRVDGGFSLRTYLNVSRFRNVEFRSYIYPDSYYKSSTFSHCNHFLGSFPLR